jgi:5,10-methylene-tetrahydrofolate dehydrogenase/methenyl tetrahydrofolate cyclohydrolase
MALQRTSPEGIMFVLSSLETTLQNEDITVVGRGEGGRRRIKGEICVRKSENITCIQIRIYG